MGNGISGIRNSKNKEQGDVSMKKAMTIAFAFIMLSILPMAMSDDSDGAELEMKGRLSYDIYYADIPVRINNSSGYVDYSFFNYRGINNYIFFEKDSENHKNFLNLFKDGSNPKTISVGDIPNDIETESNIIYVFPYNEEFEIGRTNNNPESQFSLKTKDFTLYKKFETIHLVSGQDVSITVAKNVSYFDISLVGSSLGALTGSYQSYYEDELNDGSVTFLCASTGDYLIRSWDSITVEYSIQCEDVSETNVIFGYIGLAIGLMCILSLVLLGRPQKLN